jgi:hypothetical protein
VCNTGEGDHRPLLTCPADRQLGALEVGMRTLFPDTSRDRVLELVDRGPPPSGVTIQVYRTAGRR